MKTHIAQHLRRCGYRPEENGRRHQVVADRMWAAEKDRQAEIGLVHSDVKDLKRLYGDQWVMVAEAYRRIGVTIYCSRLGFGHVQGGPECRSTLNTVEKFDSYLLSSNLVIDRSSFPLTVSTTTTGGLVEGRIVSRRSTDSEPSFRDLGDDTGARESEGEDVAPTGSRPGRALVRSDAFRRAFRRTRPAKETVVRADSESPTASTEPRAESSNITADGSLPSAERGPSSPQESGHAPANARSSDNRADGSFPSAQEDAGLATTALVSRPDVAVPSTSLAATSRDPSDYKKLRSQALENCNRQHFVVILPTYRDDFREDLFRYIEQIDWDVVKKIADWLISTCGKGKRSDIAYRTKYVQWCDFFVDHDFEQYNVNIDSVLINNPRHAPKRRPERCFYLPTCGHC